MVVSTVVTQSRVRGQRKMDGRCVLGERVSSKGTPGLPSCHRREAQTERRADPNPQAPWPSHQGEVSNHGALGLLGSGTRGPSF